MKRSFTLFTALLTLLAMLSFTAFAEDGEIVVGDVDGDGEVTFEDYIITRLLASADANSDGVIDESDYTAIYQYVLENINLPEHVHKIVNDEAIEPTCETAGRTAGSHCAICGEVIEKSEIIPAKGHTVVTDEGKEATCTENGITYGAHCSVCGEVFVPQTVVKAKGHISVVDAAIEPTCTETGLTEGSHCAICGEVITVQQTVNAKGHVPVIDNEVAATCTETGLTAGAHCSVCGEVIVAQQIIKAKGHTVVIDSGYAATCTENGITYGAHCSVCGEVLVAQQIIKAKGHTVVIDSGYAATCTETGLTDGAYCSVCGKALVSQETLPASGHAYGTPTYTWNDKECTASVVCANDEGHKITETVTGVYVKDTDATYTADETGHYEASFKNSRFTKQSTAKGSVVKYGTKLEEEPEPVSPICVVGEEGIAEVTDEDLAKLLDGVYASDAAAFSDARLMNINWNAGYDYSNPTENGSKKAAIYYNFGETINVTGIKLGAFKDRNSFIDLPGVKIYLTTDGETYVRAADGKWTSEIDGLANVTDERAGTPVGEAIYFADWSTRAALAVKGVMIELELVDPFTFLSELEIVTDYVADDALEENIGHAVDTIKLGGVDVAIADATATILTSAAGEISLEATAEGDYRLARAGVITIAKWDDAVNGYRVTFNEVNPWPNERTGSLTIADDEIGVFTISSGTIKNAGAGDKWVIWHIEVGDVLYVYDDVIAINHMIDSQPSKNFMTEEPGNYTYSEPVYNWNNDTCTALRVCLDDSSLSVIETVKGVYVKDTDATYTADETGHYEASFKNSRFTKQSTAKGSVVKYGTRLDNDSPIYAPSVTAYSGDTVDVYLYFNDLPETTAIGLYFDAIADGLTLVNGIISMEEKPPFKAFDEDGLSVAYDNPIDINGEYIVLSFRIDDDVPLGEYAVDVWYVFSDPNDDRIEGNTMLHIDVIGENKHTYNDPVYTWNGNKCTATRVCVDDSSHTVTETVKGVYVKDTDATYTTDETGHYEASFKNSHFTKQSTAKGSKVKYSTRLDNDSIVYAPAVNAYSGDTVDVYMYFSKLPDVNAFGMFFDAIADGLTPVDCIFSIQDETAHNHFDEEGPLASYYPPADINGEYIVLSFRIDDDVPSGEYAVDVWYVFSDPNDDRIEGNIMLHINVIDDGTSEEPEDPVVPSGSLVGVSCTNVTEGDDCTVSLSLGNVPSGDVNLIRFVLTYDSDIFTINNVSNMAVTPSFSTIPSDFEITCIGDGSTVDVYLINWGRIEGKTTDITDIFKDSQNLRFSFTANAGTAGETYSFNVSDVEYGLGYHILQSDRISAGGSSCRGTVGN